MADIVVTAAKVQRANAAHNGLIVDNYIAAEAITVGQAVYLTTAGKAGVADANASGKQQCVGICIGVQGDAVSVCSMGIVAGFTLTGNAKALIYLSDTAGALADAAGTMTVPVGCIWVATDGTKLLRVWIPWNNTWS